MTQSDIKHDLNKGEGLTVDFKKATDSLPVNLFETVCKFESPNYVSYSNSKPLIKERNLFVVKLPLQE